MKELLFLLTTVLFALLTTGCEGYRCATGSVVDKTTNRLLDSVFCEVITGRQTLYTDSTGGFDLCNPFGGCVPRCKDINVRFSKAGYKTVLVENPESKTVIYLEK